jgi:hypothetical protein
MSQMVRNKYKFTFLLYLVGVILFTTEGTARVRVPGAMPILKAKLEKLGGVGRSLARFGKEEYSFDDLIQPLIIHGSFKDFLDLVNSPRIVTKTAGLLCLGSVMRSQALDVLEKNMESPVLVPRIDLEGPFYSPLGTYALDAMVALVNQGVTDSKFVLKPSELIRKLIKILATDDLTYLHFRASSILKEFIGEKRLILNLKSLLIQLKEFSSPVLVKAFGRALSKEHRQNSGQALIFNFLWKCYEDNTQSRSTRLGAASALLRFVTSEGLDRLLGQGEFIQTLSHLELKSVFRFDVGEIRLQEESLRKLVVLQDPLAWGKNPVHGVREAFKALVEIRRGIREHFLSWDGLSNLRFKVFDALYLAYPGTYHANPYQFQFLRPFGWPSILSQRDVLEQKLDQRFELKLRPLLIIEN